MKKILMVTIGVLCSMAIVAVAADQGKGKKNGKATRAQVERTSHVDVHVAFGTGEIVILREHYGPRYRNLPPGLQKKVARGGALPPGWRKKFEPFPVAVERRLAPLPAGYRRGVVDGHAVIYNERTNVIIDFAVLF